MGRTQPATEINRIDIGDNDVLFLDLKKASDTVDHSILLKKLQLYGLDSHAVQWFKSYLSNRFQSTLVNGILSDYLPVSCGVPQGLCLDRCYFSFI